MISRTNPDINVDALMAKVNEQINRSTAASLLDAEGVRVLSTDAVTAVARIEAFIEAAEDASQVRTSLGRVRSRFPFNVAPLRGLFLRALAFVFRDQRQVNAALIDALRTSLQLNVRLCEQLDAMRARVDEIERHVRP